MREPIPEDLSPTQKLAAMRQSSNRDLASGLAHQMRWASRIREMMAGKDHDGMLRLSAHVLTDLLVDPETRELAIHASGLKPHYYRAITLGDRQAPDMDHLRESLGPFAPFVSSIFFKMHPYRGDAEGSRLEREARRIEHYQRINEQVALSRGVQDYNPVPRLLALQSRDGISVIAEERIRGECLYERLLKMQNETQAHRFGPKNSRRRIEDFRKFVGGVIDRIVRAQSATLSLPTDLIDKVHLPRGKRDRQGINEGSHANAEFYLSQMHHKFIGTDTSDDSGFRGALTVLLDHPMRRDRELVRNLRSTVGNTSKGVYYPIAYLLGSVPAGVDSDRSLWNIMYHEEKDQYPMVDFETVTDSPHAMALANATAQGVYIFNQRTRLQRPLTLEGQVVFPVGVSVAARDLLRWHYMSKWNEEVRANASAGLYGANFDLSDHLLTNFNQFKLAHAAAGVQRACVHVGTFVKIMYNMITDGDDHGYDLALKGMLISLTHVSDSIQDYRAALKRDPRTFEFVEQLYARSNTGSYFAGLSSLTADIRDVRQHLKLPHVRHQLRRRIEKECYR